MNRNHHYLSSQALTEYGFQSQPFQYTNSLTEIYADGRIKIKCNEWLDVIEKKDYLFFIDGPSGCGKSSFGKLLTSYDASRGNIRSYFLTCSPVKTTINFLSILLKPGTFNSNDSLKTLSSKAATEIYSVLKNKELPLIVLDNCHTLQTKMLLELLKFCHNFYGHFPKAPRIVLIGPFEEIKKKIEGSDSFLVEKEKFHLFTCPPLERSQIRSYLTFKFKEGGVKEPAALARQLPVSNLAEHRGNYKKLNELVVELLEDAMQERIEREFEVARKRKKMKITAASAVVLVSVIIIFVFT